MLAQFDGARKLPQQSPPAPDRSIVQGWALPARSGRPAASRWSRRRLLQRLALALLVGVGSAGVERRIAAAQAAAPVDRFVGTVADSNAFLAVALSPSRDAVAAYVCDVDPTQPSAVPTLGSVWFRGASSGVSLPGALLLNGAYALVLDLQRQSPVGALFLPDGSVHGFQLNPTTQGGFFYAVPRDNLYFSGGWIFLADGELRGELTRLADNTAFAAPLFTPGPAELQVAVPGLGTAVAAAWSETASPSDPPLEAVDFTS